MSYASGVETKWKCIDCGYEWDGIIAARTLRKTFCNKCACKNVGETLSKKASKNGNDLQTWCDNNGEYGKKLLTEYLKSNKQPASEIAYRSHKILNWTCNKGHQFEQMVYDRAIHYYSCPYCSKHSTSYPEQFLYRALKQIYPNTINRGKYQGIEYDITIPEEKLCIEYSGWFWHEDKEERDEMKANICHSHNVRFIQIYAHDGRTKINNKTSDDYIVYERAIKQNEHNKQLTDILDIILKSLDRSISEIDIEKAQTEAYNFMYSIDEESNIKEVKMLPKSNTIARYNETKL